MPNMPEGFHVLHDAAKGVRSIYEHLCAQREALQTFQERFWNVFDTNSLEMSVRSIAAPGTGIVIPSGTTVLQENPRRKGFMVFNSGAVTDKMHVKLGRTPFIDLEDYSFFMFGGAQAIVSGPNGDFPTWRGAVHVYWSVAAAGAQLKITEFA